MNLTIFKIIILDINISILFLILSCLLLFCILLMGWVLNPVRKRRIIIKTGKIRWGVLILSILLSIRHVFKGVNNIKRENILFDFINFEYAFGTLLFIAGLFLMFETIIINKNGWKFRISNRFNIKHENIKNYKIKESLIEIESKNRKYTYKIFKISRRTISSIEQKLKELEQISNSTTKPRSVKSSEMK